MQSSQDSLTVEDSDTQSLTASVTDYPIEHGRRYHRYHEGGMLSLRLGGWFTINRFWLTRCLSIHLPKRRAGTRSSGHAASHVQTRKWGSAVLFTSTKSPADSRHRHRLWDLADGNGYAPLHFSPDDLFCQAFTLFYTEQSFYKPEWTPSHDLHFLQHPSSHKPRS